MSHGAHRTNRVRENVGGDERLRLVVAAGRTALALAIAAAIIATVVDVTSRGPINPFNFFGYFTIQSNIFMMLVWAWLAIAAFTGRAIPRWGQYVRGAVTTYIVIVGLVYALLLAPLGEAGGVPVAWANVVLHLVVPLAALADWVFAPDRERLRMRRLWVVVTYPLLWLGVVLVRGATDGWVPYPFLDPSLGYDSVALVCVLIAVATLGVGVAVFAISRIGSDAHRR